jgi:transcription antitermination factor NusG
MPTRGQAPELPADDAFAVGDLVGVLEGPFAGSVGKIESKTDSDRYLVKLEACGPGVFLVLARRFLANWED